MIKPEPAEINLFTGPPQEGQAAHGSSLMFWNRSKRLPHDAH